MAPEPTTGPVASSRRVTAFTAACLLVSNMVGTGIFATTGFMARDLGSPGLVLLLWLLGGAFSLLGAACYAELGAALPRAGGEYVYLREAYGPLWGFLSGWASFTIGFGAAIASAAHLFSTHLRELARTADLAGGGSGLLATPAGALAVALAMVWGLTLVHAMGVGVGGFAQRLLTTLKVLAIAGLVALGLAFGPGDWGHLRAAPATAPPLTAAAVSFLFVTFSYSGWNAAAYIASEIRDPGRALPRAMLAGTAAVAALYVSLNLLYVYALSIPEQVAEPVDAVALKAAVALFGDGAAPWVAGILCLSILGATSAMIWAGPRVYQAMASDGRFPRPFATLDRRGTPVRAILLQSLWVTVLVATGTYERLVVYASFVLIAFTALAAGAVPLLRRGRPDLPRPYRLRGGPLAALAYVAISLVLMAAALRLRPVESLLGVATVAAGAPLHALWSRRGRPR